jgi:phosphosulfolactate synthase (CoM biosynthesis protein A)
MIAGFTPELAAIPVFDDGGKWAWGTKSVFILDKYLISNFTNIVQDADLVVLEGMDQKLLHRNFNVHFKYNVLKLAVVKD